MNIRRVEDISINDIELKNQYYNYFISGNIIEAKKIIEDNPDLKFKVLNADNLNKIIEYILSLEKRYYDNVSDVLSNHLTTYQITIDNLLNLKDFNINYQYNINNFVLYNNRIYFCINIPPIGTLPTNSEYWVDLNLLGDKAYPSIGVKYQGNWISTKTYNKFDMVVYQNKLYVSKNNNTNKVPDISLDSWSMQMEIISQGLFVGSTEPANIKQNNIWLQIL